MYQKMNTATRKNLKNQFDFSASELNQIENFISRNMGQSAKDILENLMDDKNLSARQKVLVSYILGTSVGVESIRRDMEEEMSLSSIRDNYIHSNIKIGQGG